MQENPNLEQEQEEQQEDVDYVQAIKELKANSVPKEKYEKVVKQNKELLDSVLNGKEVKVPQNESAEDKRNKLKTLSKEMAQAQDKGMTNLEYVTKALEYRKTAISLGLQDPFLPNGPMGPTELDISSANKTAEVLQSLVDKSEGNPTVFRNLFTQTVRDDPKIPLRKKNN